MSYTGGCACGAITLQISGEPLTTRQCWCQRCRRIAAGGPTNNAMFRFDDVKISGRLATRNYMAESGNTITHSFCPACGTPLMARSLAKPEVCVIRLGAIAEPHELKPVMAIWTDEAPPWALIDPALEQYPRQPPPPPAA